MTDTTTGTEKVAGTNLTTVAEFAKSALALSELQARYKGLVVAVDTPKGMKDAKAATFELRTLRTSLEKMRKDLKAPIIERGKQLDDEAKRLTAEIVALEEPIDVQIKAHEAKVQQELLARQAAEQERVDGIRGKIQAFRDEPSKLTGKPSAIINGALVRLRDTTVDESFAEFTQEAQDALTAAISHITTMLAQQQAHEAEQAQIKADREKLAKLEKEAADRRAADARKEAEARAEADRLAQVERDRVAAIEEAERVERIRVERERDEAERAARDAEFKAERDRLEAEQRKLDEQAAQIKREQQAAAAEAERARLAGLGLREAAQAVVDGNNSPNCDGEILDRLIADLAAALANDAAPAKPARKGKKS